MLNKEKVLNKKRTDFAKKLKRKKCNSIWARDYFLVLFQTQSCGISLLKLWSWTCVHPLSIHLPLILSILKVYHWFIESLQVAQWLISCRRWLPLEIMLTMQEVLRCTLNSIDYWNYYYFYHYHCSLIQKIIWLIGALRSC